MSSAADEDLRATPLEYVISVRPFIVRRRIAFRDCDPAGIVYTPRFLDPIATGATDLFLSQLIGPMENRDEGLSNFGTPAKATEFVFHKGVKLGAEIDVEVFCKNIGNTSFALGLVAHDAEGTPLFDGSLTLIAIQADSFTAVDVPEVLRNKLESYMRGE